MKTPTPESAPIEDFGPSFFIKDRMPLATPATEPEALLLNRRRTEALESIAESLRFIAAGEIKVLG
jgi:hypothetical protein